MTLCYPADNPNPLMFAVVIHAVKLIINAVVFQAEQQGLLRATDDQGLTSNLVISYEHPWCYRFFIHMEKYHVHVSYFNILMHNEHTNMKKQLSVVRGVTFFFH